MKYPRTRNENIVVQEMDSEILIYDLKENKAFCLNETSAIIYQLCDGKRSVAEIADLMSIKLKTLVGEELVWLALDKLKQDDLLEKSVEIAIDYKGLTRRQAIKKAGFASMIALPIVSSITAPTAAHAASGLAALFAACTSPSDCASNFCTSGPPRCCVPGTSGFRAVNVCCAGANCNSQCCSNTGTISPSALCAGIGFPFLIACPDS